MNQQPKEGTTATRYLHTLSDRYPHIGEELVEKNEQRNAGELLVDRELVFEVDQLFTAVCELEAEPTAGATAPL